MLMRFFKQYVVALVATILLLISHSSFATTEAKFVEGRDYVITTQTRTDKNELREFYSYWCGHCFGMQGVFEELAEHVKGRAELIRNPVGLLGGTMGEKSVSAYAAAKILGIEDEFNLTLFKNIHEKNEIPRSNQDFVEIFKSLGVPENLYQKELSAFPTVALVAEYNKWTEKSGIEAVPEILINGKYLAKLDHIESVEDFNSLIDYLLTLP